jgi:hypothetical protein
MNQCPSPEEDYAVAAARKVVASRAAREAKSRRVRSQRNDDHKAKSDTSTSSHPVNETPEGIQTEEDPVRDDTSMDLKSRLNESTKKERALNLRLVDEQELEDETTTEINDLHISNKKEAFEMENMKKASKFLDDIANQGTEMTPEDLLRDVLKFDEEQKTNEKPGSGFASGAFEKAKELLNDRHQHARVKTRTRPAGFEKNFEDMTQEEQLKAMFAAGQQMADGRIAERVDRNKYTSSGIQGKRTADEDVDELIAKDRSISGHARILDDELAELELCINRSPGEELDGPMQNPFFDIMSGPEVYNPNVELDNVNYPGALPGTKDVKLPKELKEAVNQAKFAASILDKLKTVEGNDGKVQYFSGSKELTVEQVETLQRVVTEASEIGIIIDPVNYMAERSRLQLILDELWNQPEERFQEIASNYKDLLLSDNFVRLIRERLAAMVERDIEALRRDDESLKEPHEREREILGRLVTYAQLLVKEARALGAELEAQQLEVIRSICKVAMDPSHTTEEETALALSDAVRDMRPLLDDVFVAYLKYAVAEEESRLARAGILDDPDYNQWLFVLKIVQQGVYAEIAKGINRYIEHIWYVLRMDSPQERRKLLEMLVEDMPTMDVRPFVQVVENIVCSLGDAVQGDFDGVVPLGEITNKLLQLHRDLKEVLPPDLIALKSRDADEWAARQKKRLLEQRQLGKERLKNAIDVEGSESNIEAFGRGEMVDHFD